jgi:D-3-phosphoglycerate dehydrogenase
MAAVKILAADSVSLSGARILPKNKFSLVSKPGISNSGILKDYSDFDVLLIRSTRTIDESFIKSSDFRIIATFTKGVDHIDLDAARVKGIRIINAEEGNHISAAEHTLALMLSVYKNIKKSDKIARGNRFSNTDFERHELYGKTVGIIGYGKVGSYVGKLCSAFGMNVLANDIDRKVVSLNSGTEFRSIRYILRRADIVSLHIPYSKENDRFFSKKMFGMMKKESLFINTSRGGVVDEEALISSLTSSKIGYAGLDVFMNEPSIDKRFRALKNVQMTNHIAGKTVESKERISKIVFEKIRAEYQL